MDNEGEALRKSMSHELSQIILSPPPQDPIYSQCTDEKTEVSCNSGTAQIILTPVSDLLTTHVTHNH